MILTVNNLKQELRLAGSEEKATLLQRFFKTGKGQYGEGDKFLGLTVPVLRKLAKKYSHLSLSELSELINSYYHEDRLGGLIILTYQFAKADVKKQKEIYDFYLANTKNINNWDLVDLSAYKIVGPYLENKDKSILKKLARSKNLWERRIAVLSTFHYIKNRQSREALEIAGMLLNDEHDLIHKAVGWMLREIGKRCGRSVEEEFLKKHYKQMPRTMLRYAIEHFEEAKRQKYLKGQI